MVLGAGTRLGHYEVLSALGAGGMGEVYRARDTKLGREVAIKLLLAEVAGDPERLARFGREARVLASLNHPNIATLYGFETDGDTSFLVMELVEGVTLADRIARGPIPQEEALPLFLKIAEGLEAAHGKGVVHRDLKPANIKLGTDGAGVKILDFGLAKSMDPDSQGPHEEPETRSPTLPLGATRLGEVLGTAAYMSPEQARGVSVDERTDVWAFGVCLFEALTAERPFQGESRADLFSSILRDTTRLPADLSDELPQGLDRILELCLEKDRDRRYPSATELRAAIASLQANQASEPSRSLHAVTSLSTEKRYRAPLVGREDEAARLDEALDRASSGGGSLVTLAGEPGVGKTRLASHAMERGRSAGFLTLVGHCYEGEGARPFSPWVEILDATARIAPKDTLRELLGDGAPEVAKLHPGLRRLFPDLPPPLEMPPEAERSYLFDCFSQFVERSSRLQPMLLVLEDLQWADEPTLLLVQHLTQRIGGIPVLVLGTYRDVELDVALPLAKVLRELVRERRVQRISLGRLSEANVGEMLKALSALEPPRSLVEAIHGETEGNPFFVEEVYEHLAEEGRLFDGEGNWKENLTLEALEVPEGVRLVVGRRLERLDEDARQILIAAAVLGRRFSYSLLETLHQERRDTVLAGIEAAERLHLIEAERNTSSREARYRFAHELIRQTLLQGHSLPRLQQLHAQVAAAIEQHYLSEVEEHASALAHHLYQAGAAADQVKTIRFLLLAGDQALATGAFEEALRNFELALSLMPADDRPGRAAATWKGGLARRSLGFWEETIAEWEKALRVYEELGDRNAIVTTASEMAFLLNWKGRPRESVVVARHTLEVVGREADVCRLLAEYGRSLSLLGDLAEADKAIAESVAMSAAHGAPGLHAEILILSAYHHYFSANRPSQAETALRAIEILRPAGDLWNLADAVGMFHLGSVGRGRLDDGARFADDAQPLARRLGHLGAQLHALMARGQRDWLLSGDLAQFEAFGQEALDLCAAADMPWVCIFEAWLGLASFWRGRWPEARERLREATNHEVASAISGHEWGLLFLLESHLGRKEEALAMLEERRSLFPRAGQINTVGSWQALFGTIEGLVVIGERSRAGELYPLALEAIATGAVIGYDPRRLLQLVAGIAAGAAGAWQEAEEHFQIALTQAHEIPFRSEQPEVRRFYAEMLVARNGPGDRDRARGMIEAAIEGYRQIGMPKHIEIVKSLWTSP